MTQHDLILRTRIDVLRRNLEDVEHVLETVEERRKDMRGLLALPESAVLRDALAQIDIQITEARHAVAASDRARVEECLDTLSAATHTIRGALRDANTTARAVGQRWLQLESGELHNTLRELLVGKAHEQIEVLDAIRHDVLEKASNASDEEAAQVVARAWRRLGEETQESTREVFHEYVDLLGGLALRESGFDQGICTIADQLVSTSGTVGFRWSSVTIPVREEALNVTLAWIVRLGFPEWTIWALPLAAHELGHVVVRQNVDMQQYIGDHADGDRSELRNLEVCMADAFAAYVMGPAYACCLLLTRLDPVGTFGGPPDVSRPELAARRAEVVLAMLQHMSDGSRERPWDELVKRLRAEWNAALTQAGRTPPPTASEDEVRDVVRFMARKVGVGRGLPTAKWERIAGWAAKLRDGTSQQIQPLFDDELRFVLNAAWLCRLESPSIRELDRVAERARALWERIETAHAGQGGGPGWAGARR
jgi:hypothetical protein